jgi:hypothetical protein
MKHLFNSILDIFFLPGFLDRWFFEVLFTICFCCFFKLEREREREKKTIFQKKPLRLFSNFFSASPVNFPFGKTSPFLSVMSWERRRRRRGKRRKCAQGRERQQAIKIRSLWSGVYQPFLVHGTLQVLKNLAAPLLC